MANTISEIVKESIEQLRRENLSLTPDNYHRIFCKVAKKKGLIVEDCQKIDKFSKKLDEKNQSDLKKFKVTTLDELISFLIAKVNRANEYDSTKVINALVLLSKRVLQAITLLHDQKARELANSSLSRLDFSQNFQSIDTLKEKWFEFVTQYDDAFLKELDIYGSVHKDDLQKMVKDVRKILQKDENTSAYDSMAPLIIASLVPSIASSMNDELADISYMLRSEPSSLETNAVQQEIKRFINKRISLDKEEIKVKISSLDCLIDEINKRILNLIDSSDTSRVQVGLIKKNLQDMNFSKDGFEFLGNRNVQGPVYDALSAFFTNGTRGNYSQKNALPKQIQIDKGIEYFKKKGIADWVVYDDSISLKDLEDIWDSDYIKNANMKLDKYGSQTGSRATKLKYDILNGKYKEHFGTLYYEESGDESFLPETVKDIFLF